MTIESADYKVPDKCEACGSHNIIVRALIMSNNRLMVKYVCSDCGYDIALPKTKNAAKRSNSTINHWAQQVVKRQPSCTICGRSDNLEAHHIIPVSHSLTHKYNPANGITLCKRCHWLVHNKEATE